MAALREPFWIQRGLLRTHISPRQGSNNRFGYRAASLTHFWAPKGELAAPVFAGRPDFALLLSLFLFRCMAFDHFMLHHCHLLVWNIRA